MSVPRYSGGMYLYELVGTMHTQFTTIVAFIARVRLPMLCVLPLVLLSVPLMPGAAAPGSTCSTLLHGVGLAGHNSDVSYDDPTLNITRCCLTCDAHAGCLGWTLNKVQKRCWIKTIIDNHAVDGAVSGLRPGVPTNPPTPPPTPNPPPKPCKGRCPNILHLMSDDMRPQLGCYGHSYMKTPYLDSLSASGLHFDFAYTQFAYCAPSRNSIMSGRRPERTKALNFLTSFRRSDPAHLNWVAMPQFFRQHGYFTSSAGKIYHDGMDDPASWSHPSNQTQWVGCQPGDVAGLNGNFCGVTNASTKPYTDEDLALEEGLRRMELAQASGQPWWVSIGVHRPHTPYRVPPGFYGNELYPNGTGDVVTAPLHPGPPDGAPFMSGNWEGGDIKDPDHGCPNCIVPSVRAVEYRRWYYAAVSWADHSLGRALTKLKEMGVENNTIVVFHSDHGYQLGELNEWSKKTDTELAVHVPLLVRVPWKHASLGQRTQVKAELVDLYRTLVDLAELPVGDVQPSVQGTSLAPAFDAPASLPAQLANKAAYSQIGRCVCGTEYKNHSHECGGNACCKIPLAAFNYMGYSMRTATQRFTAWVPFDNVTLRVDWNQPTALELFDLTNDDGRDFDFSGYSSNLALDPSYKTRTNELLQQLKAAVESWY